MHVHVHTLFLRVYIFFLILKKKGYSKGIISGNGRLRSALTYLSTLSFFSMAARMLAVTVPFITWQPDHQEPELCA